MSSQPVNNDPPPPYPGPPSDPKYFPPTAVNSPITYSSNQGENINETQQVTVIVQTGDCPQCKGFMVTHYPCCAIFLAIIFFPIGLLCCICLTQRKCNSCGYIGSI